MAATHKNRNSSALRNGAKVIEDFTHGARNVASEAAIEARDEALDLVKSGQESLTELGNRAIQLLKKRPVGALAIGLGVGCLVGMYLRGRR